MVRKALRRTGRFFTDSVGFHRKVTRIYSDMVEYGRMGVTAWGRGGWIWVDLVGLGLTESDKSNKVSGTGVWAAAGQGYGAPMFDWFS